MRQEPAISWHSGTSLGMEDIKAGLTASQSSSLPAGAWRNRNSQQMQFRAAPPGIWQKVRLCSVMPQVIPIPLSRQGVRGWKE